MFDVSGALVYFLTRRLLAAKKPDRSAIEPFRAAARTISDAQHEAVGASSGGVTR
jgi:hypothetical protein